MSPRQRWLARRRRQRQDRVAAQLYREQCEQDQDAEKILRCVYPAFPAELEGYGQIRRYMEAHDLVFIESKPHAGGPVGFAVVGPSDFNHDQLRRLRLGDVLIGETHNVALAGTHIDPEEDHDD